MGYHLQAVHWSNLALVTLALIELSGFPSNLAVVMLALFELSGFSSNLALVTLQLFGLYGFSSLLHILLFFFIPNVQLFALRCHFSVCCLFRLLSLWCLFLAQSLRVLLRAAFTCSSLSLFGLLFASVTPLFLAVLVVLVTCSVLASPFEGCFHLLFTVFV